MALLSAGGLITAEVIAIYRPGWWSSGLLAVAVAGAGLWGVAERASIGLEVSGRLIDARAYRQYAVLRELSAIIAIGALIAFAFLGPGTMLFGNIGVGGG